MKRFIILSVIICCLGHLASAAGKQSFSPGAFDAKAWVESNFNSRVLPPFDFDLGGKSFSGEYKKWRFSSKSVAPSQEGEEAYEFSWTSSDRGVKVTAVVKAYPKYNSIEWVLRFKNVSDANSETLSNVKSMDFDISFDGKGVCDLMYSDGSIVSKSDFQPHYKAMEAGVSHHMEPAGGRSSCGVLPFFDIISPTGKSGVIMAVGWTGTWFADIVGSRRSVSVEAGMKNLSAYLKPGEEIRTPSHCALFWNGENKMVGHNMFRRLMIDIQAPKVNGKPAVYPVCTGFNYSDPYPCNEYTCLTETMALAYVERYRDYGIRPEAFWLDAGWYENSDEYYNNKNWANTVGTWIVDPERFPRGLKPISDAVHEAGAKFMVWFEPERVIKESLWGTSIRGYMLEKKADGDAYLFDLTNPEAVRWLSDYICDFMDANGIDYYRQDFNMDVDEFWTDNDEPGRDGICEIRYIEGLYEFWDNILARFPEAIIDNCASGGRRLDLETFKRSSPLWRTDYDYGEPIGYQTHTFGLSYYLPLTGTGCTRLDQFSSRSSLGSAVTFNWKISEAESNVFDMRKYFKEFLDVRPYFYEDYYPLTEYEDMTLDTIWLAYQLYRPSDGSGYVVAFRRDEAENDSLEVKLGGLDDNSTYEFLDCDTGDKFTADGASLKKSLKLVIKNRRDSMLLKYNKISK